MRFLSKGFLVFYKKISLRLYFFEVGRFWCSLKILFGRNLGLFGFGIILIFVLVLRDFFHLSFFGYVLIVVILDRVIFLVENVTGC